MAKKKTTTGAASSSREELDVAVQFTGFSSGDETARLGMAIDRGNITMKQAEHFLCGARLELTLRADPNADKDGAGQTRMFNDTIEVETTADVKSYRASPKRLSAGITFALSAVDIEKVLHLAKRPGRIVAVRVGDADTPEEAGGDE